MEYDRKSTVSSFYGARRSIDVLNDVPTPTGQGNILPRGAARPRAESQSSFYADRQSRTSQDLLNTQSAGYNASSFFAAGRQEPLKGGRDEEEEAGQQENWDVFADFNNAGPRYSSAFGIGKHTETAYHQLPPTVPVAASKAAEAADNNSSQVPLELVTVPALGPEWDRSEMKKMTRSGRRELKSDERRAKWRAWNRGEIGLCGTKWFTKKFLVFFVFAWCAIIAIVLAITIPRVPGISFYSNSPLVGATGNFNASIPTEFSRSPANFSFPAVAEIQVDTTSNIIPLVLNHIDAQVWYPSSNFQIGSGYFGKATLPANAYPIISIPLNFSYVAPNDTDPTWVAWYNACKNPGTYTDGVRPGVAFEVILTMEIQGLLSTSVASASVSSGACPIELPITSA